MRTLPKGEGAERELTFGTQKLNLHFSAVPSGQRNTYQNPKEDNISFLRFDGREKSEQKGGGLHIHSFFFAAAAAAAGKFVVLGKSLYRVRELFEREESFFFPAE